MTAYYICSENAIQYLGTVPYMRVHTFADGITQWTNYQAVGISPDFYDLKHILIADPGDELLTVLELCGIKYMPVKRAWFTSYLQNALESDSLWIINE